MIIYTYICIYVYVCIFARGKLQEVFLKVFKNYNYEMIEKIMEIFPRFIYILITFNLAP